MTNHQRKAAINMTPKSEIRLGIIAKPVPPEVMFDLEMLRRKDVLLVEGVGL